MNESSERLLFRHLLDRPDAEIDLARAALAIAAEAYPGLEPGPYRERFPGARQSLERYEELAPGRAADDVGAQALLAVARRKRHSVN